MKKLCISWFLLLPLMVSAQLAFKVDTLSGCAPLAVQFTNQSSSYQSFSWNFGDGNTSALNNPHNLYLNDGNYDIILIGHRSNAPNDTLIKRNYISVYDQPQINYTVQNLKHCLGSDSVAFINKGDSSHLYSWSIGDGQMHQAYSFNHQYASPGDYDITLVAENIHGCTSTSNYSRQVKVLPLPQFNFNPDTSLICGLGQSVSFHSTADPSFKHYWDFGRGQVDSLSGKHANHLFQDEGVKGVSLKVLDSLGCENEVVKPDLLSVSDTNDLVSLLKTAYCTEEEIEFTLDSNLLSAQWDFQDGNSSALKNPQYAYTQPGSYRIAAKVQDQYGCESNFQLPQITVAQAPIVSLLNQALVGCAPQQLQIQLDHFYAQNFEWKLGDLQSILPEPVFNIEKSGKQDLQLRVSNQQCADTLIFEDLVDLEGGKVDFSINDSISCAPFNLHIMIDDTSNITAYKWFTGNGDSLQTYPFNYTYHQAGTYQPYLITKSKLACLDTTYLPWDIQVQDAVETFQRQDTLVLCKPGMVSFNGYAMGGNYWKWNFGDGDSSSLANPTHHFSTAGIYKVSLLTENTQACYNFYEPYNVVKVKSGIADLNMVRYNCPNYQVKFFSNDPQAERWFWDFGDGTTDTVRNPTHFYPGPGYYTIRLKSWDANNCLSEKTISAYEIMLCNGSDSIPLSQIPAYGDSMSSFSASAPPLIACTPFDVKFTFPKDTALSYLWEFGDGDTSHAKNPEHTYREAAVYSVRLIYQKPDLSFDTIYNSDYIRTNSPDANFDFSLRNYCDSSILDLAPKSKASHLDYYWSLGSAGSSNEIEPRATYHQDINELITLTVIDSFYCASSTYQNIALGSPNPFLGFDANNCYGDSVVLKHNFTHYDSVSWNIRSRQYSGDSIIYLANDSGSFPITLEVFDQNKCSFSFRSPKDLIVDHPRAHYSGMEEAIYCGRTEISFDNQSVGADKFLWVFDDGDSSRVEDPVHIYDSAAYYQPTLYASKRACVDVFQKPNPTQFSTPELDFQANQSGYCLPLSVNFTGRSQSAVRWKWFFGDGDTSNLKDPVHVYDRYPDSPVRLIIWDANGCKRELEKSVLQIHRAQPVADRWSGCLPLKIQFADTNQSIISWQWQFGDGHSSTLRNPEHTYTDSGYFDITLITQSSQGCPDTLYLPKAIYVGNVQAEFKAEGELAACAPHLLQFENLSSGANSYEWRFEKHGSAKRIDPLQIFSKAGLFDISLYASDGKGCVDSLEKKDYVNINTPEIEFSMSDTSVCGPQEIRFEDQSKRVAERQWYLGDGGVSASAGFTHYFDSVKSYQISLMVKDTAGCVEYLSKRLRVRRQPMASFALDTLSACAPISISFKNQSKNLEEPTFWWSFNGQPIATQSLDTNFYFSASRAYQTALMVENSNQCRDTAWARDLLKVYATKEPNNLVFSRIDQLLNGNLRLEWLKDTAFEFHSYKIYQQKNGGVQLIYETTDREDTSIVIDRKTVENSSKCFKLASEYHCSPSINPDSLESYCAIELATLAQEDGIHLNWSAFYPMEDLSYQVYKTSLQKGEFELLGTYGKDQRSLIDSSAFCMDRYIYRIKAVYKVGRAAYASFSDTSMVQPKARVLNNQSFAIKRVSVVDDRSVFVEWENDQEMRSLINGYYLYRSKLRSGKEIISHLPASSSSYLDMNADIDHLAYTYSLQLDHNCQQKLAQSNSASSIFLEVTSDGGQKVLKWTEAKGLKGGVKEYILQQQDEFGNWEEVKRVPADQLKYYLEKD